MEVEKFARRNIIRNTNEDVLPHQKDDSPVLSQKTKKKGNRKNVQKVAYEWSHEDITNLIALWRSTL